MTRSDPRLRLACRSLNRLVPKRSHGTESAILDNVVERQRELERSSRFLSHARRRGWSVAAAMVHSRMPLQIRLLQADLTQLLSRLTCPAKQPPALTLRSLLEEFEQLESEFEQVEYRLKDQVIAVRTDSITLEDVELGPFSMELHLKRLSQPSSGCFDCVALDPNPAASNSSVTHPHVSDKSLCAGDAALPIAAALQQGRLADAFCLVNAVLHEYNSSSPYVSLDQWSGTRCEDCDAVANDDDLYQCDGCERRCCDCCRRCCAGCDQVFCDNCLELDEQASAHYCKGCRSTCSACGRTVDRDSVDQDTGRCPGCSKSQAAKSQAADSQEQDDPTDEEQSHDLAADPTLSAPVQAAGPADFDVLTAGVAEAELLPAFG
jgi:hypothetical protein